MGSRRPSTAICRVTPRPDEELIRQAAQCQVVHNEDTTMKVLELMKENKHLAAEGKQERRGMFTTGIVSLCEGRRIALFLTGREHAGENLTQAPAPRLDRAHTPDPPLPGDSPWIPGCATLDPGLLAPVPTRALRHSARCRTQQTAA